MIARALSDSALLAMHQMTAEALRDDDALPKGNSRWGMRDHHDWKKQADEIELVMTERGIEFTPIDWTLKS